MPTLMHCYHDVQAGIPGHENKDEAVIVAAPFPAFENLHGHVTQRYVHIMHPPGLYLNILQYFP